MYQDDETMCVWWFVGMKMRLLQDQDVNQKYENFRNFKLETAVNLWNVSRRRRHTHKHTHIPPPVRERERERESMMKLKK